MKADPDLLKYIQTIMAPIAAFADTNGFGGLNEHQKIALRVYYAKGVIDNGGFQYLFELGRNPINLAHSYEAIGVKRAADAARKAYDRIVEVMPLNSSEEISVRSEAPPTLEFDDLDDIIYDSNEEIVAALASFIRSHGPEIGTS